MINIMPISPNHVFTPMFQDDLHPRLCSFHVSNGTFEAVLGWFSLEMKTVGQVPKL
jgi:hypothetical protein